VLVLVCLLLCRSSACSSAPAGDAHGPPDAHPSQHAARATVTGSARMPSIQSVAARFPADRCTRSITWVFVRTSAPRVIGRAAGFAAAIASNSGAAVAPPGASSRPRSSSFVSSIFAGASRTGVGTHRSCR
jgi:hypothetical protein